MVILKWLEFYFNFCVAVFSLVNNIYLVCILKRGGKGKDYKYTLLSSSLGAFHGAVLCLPGPANGQSEWGAPLGHKQRKIQKIRFWVIEHQINFIFSASVKVRRLGILNYSFWPLNYCLLTKWYYCDLRLMWPPRKPDSHYQSPRQL